MLELICIAICIAIPVAIFVMAWNARNGNGPGRIS